MAQLAGRARELQRNAVRSAITDAATKLFLERGYEETTMEDIAAAVGVSVRTLFRYMATKEEMLLGPMAATGAILAGWIRDAEAGAMAWDALIDVVSRFAADLASEGERAKARSRLVVMTPQLRGGLSDKRRLWMDEMSPAVQERLSGNQDAAVIARAMVASALAALDVTAEHWAFADRDIDLPSLFRRAADAVRRLVRRSSGIRLRCRGRGWSWSAGSGSSIPGRR
jgi:AcrR family transcriptional regulator